MSIEASKLIYKVNEKRINIQQNIMIFFIKEQTDRKLHRQGSICLEIPAFQTLRMKGKIYKN